jgi:outer membrane protein OmpA-like peptidoglycan-associated protein
MTQPTASGQLHFASEGGNAGSHECGGDFKTFVAPAAGKEYNTVTGRTIPIACWSVGDIRFEFDSSLVRPELKLEIQQLAELRERHKQAAAYPPLSIFGHADPTGSDDYNKKLSGRRATAIYGLITKNPDLWEQLHSNPIGNDTWGVKATQQILTALGFLADATSGTMDEPTRAAVKAFQQDNGLAVDGDPGPQTRRKLYLKYMDLICGPEFVLTKQDFLGRGADKGGKADYQGCSEFNPLLMFSQSENDAFKQPDKEQQRNDENAPNRRVVVFLFRPGSQVMTSRWPCPRVSEGAEGCHKRFWSDASLRRSFQDKRRIYEESKDTFACRFYEVMATRSPCERAVSVLRVRLHDCFGQKLPGVRYLLEYGGSRKSAQADQEGFIAHVLEPGAETCRIRWEPVDPDAADPQDFLYEWEVYVQLPDIDDEQGIKRRLHNLGYFIDRDFEGNVRAFQSHHDLEITGSMDDDTKSKLQAIYDGALDDSVENEDVAPPDAPDSEQRT